MGACGRPAGVYRDRRPAPGGGGEDSEGIKAGPVGEGRVLLIAPSKENARWRAGRRRTVAGGPACGVAIAKGMALETPPKLEEWALVNGQGYRGVDLLVVDKLQRKIAQDPPAQRANCVMEESNSGCWGPCLLQTQS